MITRVHVSDIINIGRQNCKAFDVNYWLGCASPSLHVTKSSARRARSQQGGRGSQRDRIGEPALAIFKPNTTASDPADGCRDRSPPINLR